MDIIRKEYEVTTLSHLSSYADIPAILFYSYLTPVAVHPFNFYCTLVHYLMRHEASAACMIGLNLYIYNYNVQPHEHPVYRYLLYSPRT